MPYPEPPVGQGFSADDLQRVHMQRIRERLATELPALHGRAVAVLAAHRKANADLAQLKLELAGAFGGDGLKLALDGLEPEVEAAVQELRAAEARAKFIAKGDTKPTEPVFAPVVPAAAPADASGPQAPRNGSARKNANAAPP